MLRISGAAQVFEELLTEGQPAQQNQAGTGETQLASAQADDANARPLGQNLGNLPGTTQLHGEL